MKKKITGLLKSIYLEIPRSADLDARLAPGSVIRISVENGGLRIRSVQTRRYKLSDLLKGIRESNLHGEIPTGSPAGRETW